MCLKSLHIVYIPPGILHVELNTQLQGWCSHAGKRLCAVFAASCGCTQAVLPSSLGTCLSTPVLRPYCCFFWKCLWEPPEVWSAPNVGEFMPVEPSWISGGQRLIDDASLEDPLHRTLEGSTQGCTGFPTLQFHPPSPVCWILGPSQINYLHMLFSWALLWGKSG